MNAHKEWSLWLGSTVSIILGMRKLRLGEVVKGRDGTWTQVSGFIIQVLKHCLICSYKYTDRAHCPSRRLYPVLLSWGVGSSWGNSVVLLAGCPVQLHFSHLLPTGCWHPWVPPLSLPTLRVPWGWKALWKVALHLISSRSRKSRVKSIQIVLSTWSHQRKVSLVFSKISAKEAMLNSEPISEVFVFSDLICSTQLCFRAGNETTEDKANIDFQVTALGIAIIFLLIYF